MDTTTAMPTTRPEHGYWLLGDTRVKILLAAAETGGGTALVEGWMSPGDRTPLHCHPHEDETFVMLEGRARLLVGDAVLELGPGEAATGPRGVPHAYRILDDAPAHWFVVVHGSVGFDRFVEEIGRPADDLAGPTEPSPSPERVGAVAAAHGVQILGPPPAVLD